MLSSKLKHLETAIQTALDEAEARTPSKTDPEVSPLRLVPDAQLVAPPAPSLLFSFDKTRMYVTVAMLREWLIYGFIGCSSSWLT